MAHGSTEGVIITARGDGGEKINPGCTGPQDPISFQTAPTIGLSRKISFSLKLPSRVVQILPLFAGCLGIVASFLRGICSTLFQTVYLFSTQSGRSLGKSDAVVVFLCPICLFLVASFPALLLWFFFPPTLVLVGYCRCFSTEAFCTLCEMSAVSALWFMRRFSLTGRQQSDTPGCRCISIGKALYFSSSRHLYSFPGYTLYFTSMSLFSGFYACLCVWFFLHCFVFCKFNSLWWCGAIKCQ